MSIKNWPEAERPREKLLAHGSAASVGSGIVGYFFGALVRLVGCLGVGPRLTAVNLVA